MTRSLSLLRPDDPSAKPLQSVSNRVAGAWRGLAGGGGGAAAATPHSWFAADELTGFTDGDRIETWTDLSENDRHLFRVSATESTWPEYKVNQLNGLPGAVFAGNQRLKTQDAFTLITSPITVVAVLKPTAVSAQFWLGGMKGTGVRIGNRVWEGDYGIFRGNFITTVAAPQVDSRVSTIYDGASSFIDANGVVQDPTADPGTNDLSQWVLGDLGNGSGYFQGTIYEVLLYDRRLTTEELAATEGYLENKWGIGPFE